MGLLTGERNWRYTNRRDPLNFLPGQRVSKIGPYCDRYREASTKD